jgi:hypothetical protein
VGEADVPESVFVKLPPFGEKQRALVDHTGMGVTEALFYRDLAAEIPVRVPAVWFAATEGPGYIMVLEDLVASGCRFPTPADPDIEGRARDIVEQLAALHAPLWESARFAVGGDLEWLAQRGARGGAGGRAFVEQAVAVLGDQMDDEFHRIADVYLAQTDAVIALWRKGPGTLVHGDSQRARCRHRPERHMGRIPRARCVLVGRGRRARRAWVPNGNRSRSVSRVPAGPPPRVRISTAPDCWSRCSTEPAGTTGRGRSRRRPPAEPRDRNLDS